MSECERNLFRLIWCRNNNLDEGKVHLYRFTRHVWGTNSGPFIAFFAIEKLIAENLTNAGTMTKTAIENDRYMDDLLLASDSLDDLKRISLDQPRSLKAEILNCANE